MKIRQKKVEKQMSDIYIEVAKLNDFLSNLQLQAESEFVNQEDSHELTDEYVILFQGITKAIDQCRRIGEKLEFLEETIF